LIGGGRNLDFAGETTETFENTEKITSSIRELLRSVIIPETAFTIDYEWSGIMGVGNEKKPIIELIHPNIAIGVRMGGMGVAIGTLVGQKVAKLL
jgi:glycine/D-amino acid oxidase-like deaminating enzyme